MKEPSAKDRRKIKRRSLTYYMLVMDADTHETVGHLIDITSIGFLMDCPKPLPLEKDFRFRLDTSPDISDKSFITFTARSKWRQPDEIEPYLFDIGFSIIDITPHEAAIIKKISEIYAAQDTYSFPNR
jgi:hypothetical protein